MQNRAIKYRIYPSAEQKILFAKTFGCCRKIWNLMLADKITYYQQTKKMVQTTPAQYKKTYPYLKEVDSLALANVQLHLQTAYKNFFRDKKIGFPRFKAAKHCRKSYTTNCQNGSIRIENDRIRIPKAGSVKAVLHRLPEKDWKIKSATISQYGDGTYYISILFEYKDFPVSPVPVTEEQVIGLDYKSAGLYMDSNGKCQNMPGYFRMAQMKLAKKQRKLRHKVPGSKNYRKQQKRIARVYRHISNQRKDYLHKLSTATAKQYAYVCVEDLNMRSMSNRINMSEKEGKYIMQAEEFINIVYNSGYATKKNAKKYTEKHPKDSYSDQDFIDVYRFNEEKKEIDHTHCTMSPIMNGKTTAFRNGIRGNNSSGQDWIG